MSIGVYNIGCFYKKNYFFYSRHFSFLTTNNNFSTFWCWCFQPRFVFKKVENLRICGPVFDFFGKKSVFGETNMFLTILKPFCGILILRQLLKVFLLFSVDMSSPKIFSKKSKTSGFTDLFSSFFWKKKCFSRKKYVFDDFEAFLWHFDFKTIIDSFYTFFRRYFQPQKYFKNFEKFRIYGHVYESFLRQKFENRSVNPKVFDFFEIFLGLEISTEKSRKNFQ